MMTVVPTSTAFSSVRARLRARSRSRVCNAVASPHRSPVYARNLTKSGSLDFSAKSSTWMCTDPLHVSWRQYILSVRQF